MEGDDDQAPAVAQDLDGLLQGGGQGAQLVVDGDAQGLEGAGGRVDAAAGAADGPGHHGGQLRRRGDRAGGDDGAGDAPAGRLLAEPPDDVGEVCFAVGVDYFVGGEGLAVVEAHVQGRLHLEAEAALLVGELVGGQAQVEQDAVDGHEVRLLADGRQVAEVGLDEQGRVGEGLESGAGGLQGGGVGVDAEEQTTGGGGLQNGQGVATAAHRAVYVSAAGLDSQVTQDLVRHNRSVVLGRVRGQDCNHLPYSSDSSSAA